jgi:hypothetical protein
VPSHDRSPRRGSRRTTSWIPLGDSALARRDASHRSVLGDDHRHARRVGNAGSPDRRIDLLGFGHRGAVPQYPKHVEHRSAKRA